MPISVVIAGAGPAALETALALRHHAPDHVELTLLAPDGDFVYRPLSVAEPFALGTTRRYPLGTIAEDVQAAHVGGTLAAVDTDAHLVVLRAGAPLSYDVLVVTVGARATPAFPRATTFGGPEDAEIMHGLVQDVELGYVKRVAFVVPPGATWSLPVYELALMTAHRARSMYVDTELHVVTPEALPLGVFGPRASAVVGDMLDQAGVRLHTNAPARVERGTVVLPSGERLEVDRVVALPELYGPAIKGLPSDERGFIPVDRLGAVRGVEDVYAAGDATDFPVKQGGLATQQADAVASAIAARAGAPVTPRPFEPVLRGMLLTEHQPRWLRDEAAAHGETAAASYGLWWPPTKISGVWLAPYLLGRDMRQAAQSPRNAIPIEVRLDRRAHALDARA